jgi:hypothetical protein
MENEEQPFRDCVDVFAKHDYVSAANLAINLLPKRSLLWVYQLLLISLERQTMFDTYRAMIDAGFEMFAHHSAATALIKVNIGWNEDDALGSTSLDERQVCQLNFYRASRRLTLGDREAARQLFQASAESSTKCPEQHLAVCELESPEPVELILERLSCQATQSALGAAGYDLLQCSRSVIQLLEREMLKDTSIVMPCLEILMITLKKAKSSSELTTILGKIHELYSAGDETWEANASAHGHLGGDALR